MRDIQMVLECWGGWAASGHSGINYSPIAAGFKGLLPSTSKSRLSCCDNDGIAVDSAVGRLIKSGRTDEFELIELHYIHDISKSEIARKKKCSEGKIRQNLMVAETFVEACLIMAEVTLEMDVWTHKETPTEKVA
ncbi:antitermination protein [Xenorhabdus bovienii]|uniref:antiterminator Q family protein n=1 Tax=Xenorhabdus bovienii TaxID=40576 RepID=UPI0023B22C44|nr:antiterminator Q family protein [Xenorhabdus bovienii]MDE9495966.1 antitermination protein [Xenorhabdus bovienii]MDE9504367.1 antitermination protein [Xenorhabdus bovienii]MDE9571239.1 antitermination protein [Xenorhabdus bovienii]